MPGVPGRRACCRVTAVHGARVLVRGPGALGCDFAAFPPARLSCPAHPVREEGAALPAAHPAGPQASCRSSAGGGDGACAGPAVGRQTGRSRGPGQTRGPAPACRVRTLSSCRASWPPASVLLRALVASPLPSCSSPLPVGSPRAEGGGPSPAPAAEASWGVAGLTLWPSVGTAPGARGQEGPLPAACCVGCWSSPPGGAVSGACPDPRGCGAVVPGGRCPHSPDCWQDLALLSGAPSRSP